MTTTILTGMAAVLTVKLKLDFTVLEDHPTPKIPAVNIFQLNWLFLNLDRVTFSTKLSLM